MASLASWNDTATREAIVAFAEGAAQEVPPEERVALFDNDATLWCEKPMPVELGFSARRRCSGARWSWPICAGGNSNGDIPMLRFAGGKGRPALRLLVLHDDPEREFDYLKGAERAIAQAEQDGWTVISVKNDWPTVFAAPG
jgi:hypothetical protein